MDSDGSPGRHGAARGGGSFLPPVPPCLPPIKTQGGKTNEQERDTRGCPAGRRKGGHS